MNYQILYEGASEYRPDERNNHKKMLVAVVDELQALSLLPVCGAGSIAMLNGSDTEYEMLLSGQWQLPLATDVLITTQPQDLTVTVDAIDESLSVEAYCNAGGTITYQWYQNDTENTTTPTTLAGKTSATCALATDLTAGTYYYYCVLTCGGVALTSDIVTVVAEAAE